MRVAGFKGLKTEKQRRKERTRKGAVPVTMIKRSVLELIMAAARENYPNEWSGQLRAREGVVHEITMLPGTRVGRDSALVNLWMLPIDFSVVGSVHSHPSGNVNPSGADLEFFGKFGSVHIIAGVPYSLRSWRAYDGDGEPMDLEVVD
jgi:proteasome lid subunit RPN8/RPN11